VTYLTIKGNIWALTILLLLLVPTACGPGAPISGEIGPSGNTSGNSQTSGGAPEGPDGPDTSVSGQPGDPGSKPTGAVVEGVITDATGKPVAGAVVMPKSAEIPPQSVPEKAVFTDQQGHYKWILAPGKYTFSVSYNGVVMETEAIAATEALPAKLNVSLK
jgi:hypothetical protein